MANLELLKNKIIDALETKKEIICITDSDADGILSGFLIKKVFGANVVHTSAPEVDKIANQLSAEKFYVFTDLCPKDLSLLAGIEYVVVDHHFTTPEGEYIHKDTSTAACVLVYNLVKDIDNKILNLKKAIAAIAAADTFNKENQYFEEGRELYTWCMTHSEIKKRITALELVIYEYEKAIAAGMQYPAVIATAVAERRMLEEEAGTVGKYVSKQSILAVLEYKQILKEKKYKEITTKYGNCVVINDTPYISDVSFKWLAQEPQKFLVSKTKYGTLTLRGAVGGINVGVIAQQHGGGGHAAAAGIPQQIKGETLEEIAKSVKELLG